MKVMRCGCIEESWIISAQRIREGSKEEVAFEEALKGRRCAVGWAKNAGEAAGWAVTLRPGCRPRPRPLETTGTFLCLGSWWFVGQGQGIPKANFVLFYSPHRPGAGRLCHFRVVGVDDAPVEWPRSKTVSETGSFHQQAWNRWHQPCRAPQRGWVLI